MMRTEVKEFPAYSCETMIQEWLKENKGYVVQHVIPILGQSEDEYMKNDFAVTKYILVIFWKYDEQNKKKKTKQSN